MRSMPVFIGGCERSGTTFLASLLGGHRQCFAIPEAQFKFEVIRSSLRDNGSFDTEQALSRIKNNWRFRIWNIKLNGERGDATPTADSYAELIEHVALAYGKSIGKHSAKIWIDHTPANVRHGLTLLEQFPTSKMIHIIRDGRAVASSIMALDWGPNTVYRAAPWWAEKISYGLALETSHFKERIMRVRFEDLVLNPERELKMICNFIGIPYETGTRSGQGFEVPEYTKTQHQLVGGPPDSSRVNAWEHNLSKREVERFERLTCDLLPVLGYRLKYGYKARRAPSTHRLLSVATEYSMKLINRVRKATRVRKAVKNYEDADARLRNS